MLHDGILLKVVLDGVLDLFLDDLEKRRIKREAVKAERLRQRANQLVFLREHSTVKIGRRHMPR